MNAKERQKFRQTKEWKDFRNYMKELQKLDQLTLKPLRKSFNLHHEDLNSNNYDKLNSNNFLCLNKKSHDVLHYIYNYYKKDKEIINRLINILKYMIIINK